MDNHEVKKRVEMLLREVQSLYAVVNADAPTFPAAAASRVSDGICLKCGKKISERQKAKVRRGCHEACYRAVMRAIERGDFTESAAIGAGKLSPPNRTGRPRSIIKLDE